jgi:hypothetical protein
MAKTLTICSWSLLALGVLMTGYFMLPRTTMELSWLLVTAWTFVPFILVLCAIRAADSVGRHAVVLVATLFVVGFGFSVYFDRTFIHRSTLDFSPIEVPLVQSLLTGVTWIGVRRRRATLQPLP